MRSEESEEIDKLLVISEHYVYMARQLVKDNLVEASFDLAEYYISRSDANIAIVKEKLGFGTKEQDV